MQKLTSAQYWKNRMKAAKQRLPKEIGQQDVLMAVAELAPELDRLTNSNRWRNAWFMYAGDPQFTEVVEKIADRFLEEKDA
ncbi:hypothetical protein LX87_05207 [Larkinella arboricola]|uniref:Uncharacterized protein n=1 Tax=Larkinella arboricola TaxID=643671 RepID=A0A327WKU3_LARAB|nr:hypothetical protein [Larkinella arboricola]RAJ92239.1 hypothetical protein LX87_05207 [Larkinella arboricola]